MLHSKNQQEFLEMIERYLKGKATPDEIRFLDLYYEQFDKQHGYLETKSEEEKVEIRESVRATFVGGATPGENRRPRKGLLVSRTWYGVAAAACIGVLAFLAIGILNSKDSKPEKGEHPVKTSKTDIPPGGNKAVLTLADGTRIVLDTAANGNLASQGNIKVIKLNGQLSYSKNSNGRNGEVLFNTINTPRGGQYQLVLADGSKVWLNAASSLRFPTNFKGSDRKVSLTGEGYFEIAENKAMPFKVDVGGKGEIEVLGTHFNVMSYSDEDLVSATLLEGRIKMQSQKTNNSINLYPGQQAQLSNSGVLSLNKTPNLEAVMGWTNEKFVFQNLKLQSIMRQLERWYDIDVTYNSRVSDDEYVGIISRKVNISEILKFLESAGGDRFRILGRKVIVN